MPSLGPFSSWQLVGRKGMILNIPKCWFSSQVTPGCWWLIFHPPQGRQSATGEFGQKGDVHIGQEAQDVETDHLPPTFGGN